MKSLNETLLGIIAVAMCLGISCTPKQVNEPVAEKPTEVVENSNSSDATPSEKAIVKKKGEITLWEATSDNWRTSTPEGQGIDSELILEMLREIQVQDLDIHSILLIRNDHLVTEVNFPPYQKEFKHPVYSVSKSLTAALVGIAIDEGHIESVDQKVLDFFPDIAQDVKSERLKNLTIEHLLTMSAGYNTRTIPYPWILSQKDASFDTISYILTHNSILQEPGTGFFYDSGAPHVLSAIIQETTGITMQAYAQEKLFGPLGITDITWETDPRGITLGCTGLALSPRDMARIGYLYLNRGRLNGVQIVPGQWVDQSTTKHMETKGLMNEAEDDGYGYLWWIDAFGGYSAHGAGGQYIFVIPGLDMVAVFTSGLANPDFPIPRTLMESFILPAATSTDPLPPSQATSDLQAYIGQIENPEPRPVPPLPETAKRISGQTFQITDSPSPYCETFSLTFDGGNVYRSESLWPGGAVYVVMGGLDNRFYVNESAVGGQVTKIALKGYWQDEKTFVEYLKDLSQIDTVTHKYTFEGDKLTLAVDSSMGSYSFQMSGEMISPTAEPSDAGAISPGSTRVAEKDGMVQVYVPAGPFTMGDTDAAAVAECQRYRDDCLPGFSRDGEPPHTVTLDAFWIDRTEVTNGMYALCVEDGQCQPPSKTTSWTHDPYYGSADFDDYPVIYVSWDDARAYCEWAGRRLPTEAEWEKAARGTDGRQYPWGNDPITGQRANFADTNFPFSNNYPQEDDGYKDVAPVGSYPDGASPYGVLDMAGNIHEWVSSLYKPYPYQPDDGREDVSARGDRVVRGNACDSDTHYLRAAYRSALTADYRGDYVGFRCASSP
jgi:formylglycine-generating enzyme required for sulfatase activity/CubicO group peptidase (beta-lactamase class C family)